MFASAIQYSVTVSTWRNPLGLLWDAGDTVALTSEGAMIYSETNFIVKNVVFTRGDTAVLELVLPEVYSGGIPENLPWD